MQPNSSGDSIIYRSGMNPKIQRNFEVFSPCDFIARITQHIPDKSFQLVRYYGWYSNKMRGQRLKRAGSETVVADAGSEVIEVFESKPRRIPSKKWRELIKKVWEADPLLCPNCQHEMRVVALIDEADVIERILRHLGLWVPACGWSPPATRPNSSSRSSKPGSTIHSPTTTTNRCSRKTENPGSAEVRPEGPPSLAFPPPQAGDVRKRLLFQDKFLK